MDKEIWYVCLIDTRAFTSKTQERRPQLNVPHPTVQWIELLRTHEKCPNLEHMESDYVKVDPVTTRTLQAELSREATQPEVILKFSVYQTHLGIRTNIERDELGFGISYSLCLGLGRRDKQLEFLDYTLCTSREPHDCNVAMIGLWISIAYLSNENTTRYSGGHRIYASNRNPSEISMILGYNNHCM
ncbi:hypothetical protein BDB01DRAFT_837148 [Pilobolus umbonatus]|nr:hypothetical protein BDB01DRAFT_837148 [Pilobolus umbonatus]